MQKNNYIVCPHCGREYLPAEIYIPKSFFGEPFGIQRDVFGKIVGSFGKQPDFRETYICDGCDNPFKVVANVKFSVSCDDKMNFSKEYTTKL